MMPNLLEPVRRCLHVHEWPELDQQAWHDATSLGHVWDDHVGRGALWRPPTLNKNRQAYGRWLSYLIHIGELDLLESPTARIIPGRVKGYVLMLQTQIQSETVWTYVVNLHQIALAFAPNLDWGWLYRISAKLHIKKRPSKNKLQRMVPAPEIAAWAYNRLEELERLQVRQDKDFLTYRNALMVAILIECPVRLRNLAMIRIDRHLKTNGDNYYLDYAPHEIKTNRYLTAHLPSCLSPFIASWLKTWRSILLHGRSADAFWIGIRGEPMKSRGIYGCIMDTTEQAFGVRINPHLFRDIAVTTIADLAPEHIGVTASILGHTNPKTTEDHYIHANQLQASRRHHDAVNDLRAQLSAQFHNPFK